MSDIIEAGLPVISPEILSFTLFVSAEILVLIILLWSFALYLDRAPSRFVKIKARIEHRSPLEIFETELARISSDPENAKIELPKLVRDFLEVHSGIVGIHAKTLAEIANILPPSFSQVFSILEEIEYSKNSSFTKKRLDDTIARLRLLAEKLLTK